MSTTARTSSKKEILAAAKAKHDEALAKAQTRHNTAISKLRQQVGGAATDLASLSGSEMPPAVKKRLGAIAAKLAKLANPGQAAAQ